VLDLAKEDLEYYDNIIEISRARFNAGDIAQIDLDRIELLRVQYESEIQTAIVNLRTSKIQLLQLLNDRTPVEQFDVTGPFDFSDASSRLKTSADRLDERPDLRAALESPCSRRRPTTSWPRPTVPPIRPSARGTPTTLLQQPQRHQTLGLSVSIPLRIFDRNQGEKKRTQIDIDRNQQLTDAARAQVFSDVDSAYEQVRKQHRAAQALQGKYNDQATARARHRDLRLQHGGASLMDFLNAQSDYRTVQLAYLQLIGAYLTAAGQLNLAVGREVIQ
jgi:outer membrane protein, heavy metal efflux system